MSDEKLLMASDAGRILDRSAEGVRYFVRVGKLRALRTADGTRLFRRADVEALAVKLRAKADARNRAGDDNKPPPRAA